ncbi:hypothetical protein M407DRAFT_23205 [Tulasnella calospora MUT 4182]|uniref:Uncharacterized protein n=1 Tax=Tulasnella calospora MUT 4182 TaxID=1051891 RepID=A0A0C3QJX7_9AGAM|nr:hypothetical protein M407DRAFT_23205 [Tulasnella calospora MUT 4182]
MPKAEPSRASSPTKKTARSTSPVKASTSRPSYKLPRSVFTLPLSGTAVSTPSAVGSSTSTSNQPLPQPPTSHKPPIKPIRTAKNSIVVYDHLSSSPSSSTPTGQRPAHMWLPEDIFSSRPASPDCSPSMPANEDATTTQSDLEEQDFPNLAEIGAALDETFDTPSWASPLYLLI